MKQKPPTNLGGLSLKKLQSFLAVAKTCNFREAAKQLNRSQPAVSIQIDSLEKFIGVALFHRTTRAVTLTPEGEAFHAHVATALGEISTGLTKISSMKCRETGKIRISCAPTVSNNLLAGTLYQFRRLHPDIEIELREAVQDSMKDDLCDGKVELGLGPAFDADSAFKQEHVFEDEIVAILPSNWELKGKGDVCLQDLAEMPLLVSGPATALWQTIDRAFKSIGVAPNIRREVVHNESLIGMVRAGLGITFIPHYVARINWRGDYAIQPIHAPALVRNICLISRRGEDASGPISSFKELVLTQMPMALDGILKSGSISPNQAGAPESLPN